MAGFTINVKRMSIMIKCLGGFVRLLIAFIFIILHFLAQEAKKW